MASADDVSFVLSFTEDMMLASIEARWDDLIEMQVEQDSLIKNLFSDNDRTFSEGDRENLIEVQRLNQEIMIAAETHKAEIANKLRDMRQGKSKAGAYQSL